MKEKITSTDMFENRIRRFNAMYGLPISLLQWQDTAAFAERPACFRSIISEELDEGTDIFELPDPGWIPQVTALCDWIGDLAVYCASEAVKYDAFSMLYFHFPDHATAASTQSGQKSAQPEHPALTDRMREIAQTIEAHSRAQLAITPTLSPPLLCSRINSVVQAGFAATGNLFTGFDPWEIISIIMDSNFSKLGPDEKPIHDARGKVLKGPGYWKPEPMIMAYLRGLPLACQDPGA